MKNTTHLMDPETMREYFDDEITTHISSIKREGKQPARFGRNASLHVIDRHKWLALTLADVAEEIGVISMAEYNAYSNRIFGAFFDAEKLIIANTEK